jgi:hypothetical protein
MKLPVLLASIGGKRPVNERDHLEAVGIVGMIMLKWASLK